MWQEIEEERENTSFVHTKRGRHRYPGLGTRKKLHWGSSRFFRRSGAATENFLRASSSHPRPDPRSRHSPVYLPPLLFHPGPIRTTPAPIVAPLAGASPTEPDADQGEEKWSEQAEGAAAAITSTTTTASSSGSAAAAVPFGSCWATAAGTSCCRMASRTWWEWCDSFP